MIECTMIPGEKEWEAMAKILCRGNKMLKVLQVIYALLGIFCFGLGALEIIAYFAGDAGADKAVIGACLVGMSAFCHYMAIKGVYGRFRRMKKKMDRAGGNPERRYQFDENGIFVHMPEKDLNLSWNEITGWGELDDFIYLRKENYVILVRENRFVTGSAEELRELIRSAINAGRVL